ncbi:hypothetical protein BV25DRAFT_1715241 [Artomyces pyxidatus]|uniref:Uncharacterized protein n=1 Tax=Artomyces pyxidatus TaxID=48021 RepID=A0ACB8TAN5_9AGAM|nr:hypothetical protein BV25DRAFT_1715241 [Artomyces pyxidatus]
MFQNSTSPSYHPQDSAADRSRPPLPHAATQSSLHASTPFTVAGLSSSTGTHHPPSPWGVANAPPSGLSNSLSDSFLQSRSTYQPGYLMSVSQNNTSPQPSQRFDELPVVQTKAKLNSTLSSRGPTSEFGKDPMFESSRQRQTMDEDAPPTASVNDIVNATYTDSPSPFQRSLHSTFEPSSSLFSSSFSRPPQPPPSAQATAEPLYVVVFGYPPDKYSVAVEYIKQFGDTTDAEPNTEIVNCFKIGFKRPADAMWAVRKNGEVVSGSWMLGIKWADPAHAESLLGQSTMRGAAPAFQSSDASTPSGNDAMPVDEPFSRGGHRASHSSTPSVGTPIRLAPSASAYRKPGQKASHVAPPHPSTPTPVAGSANLSPSKSIMGQFSDLVFGW